MRIDCEHGLRGEVRLSLDCTEVHTADRRQYHDHHSTTNIALNGVHERITETAGPTRPPAETRDQQYTRLGGPLSFYCIVRNPPPLTSSDSLHLQWVVMTMMRARDVAGRSAQGEIHVVILP